MNRMKVWWGCVLLVALTAACATVPRPREPFNPPPSPLTIPLLAGDWRNELGQPLQLIDVLAVRRLLEEHRFQELTTLLEELDRRVQKDCSTELMAVQAFDGVAVASPSLDEAVEAWVEVQPQGWVPRLVRGLYRANLARNARGTKWMSQTGPDERARHQLLSRLAVEDVRASVALHDSLVARRELMRTARRTGAPVADVDAQLDAGLALCPTSLHMRTAYVANFVPRWGGSYAAMRAYTSSVPLEQNPRLAMLAGYAPADQANLAMMSREWDEALKHTDEALSISRWHEFLADAVDPTRPYSRWLEVPMSSYLANQTEDAVERGDLSRAQALAEEADDVAHGGIWALHARGHLERGRGNLVAAIQVWRRAIAENGLVFYLVMGLERAYREEGRATEALALLDEYLRAAGSQSAPEAWQRRGLALRALHREQEARGSFAEACRRGHAAACAPAEGPAKTVK